MEVDVPDPWDRLDASEVRSRREDVEMLQAVSDLQARWPEDPCIPDLSCELAHRYGMSQYEASERIRIATALRDLPALRQAHAEGRLSRAQLRWVTKFATAETDEQWSVRAPGMTPNELKLESERQARVRREEAESDHAARYLWSSWDEGRRNLSIEGRLPAEQGAAFEEAVIEAARQVEIDEGADDPRGARQADGLMSLVTTSGGKAGRSTLVVHTDAETLAGLRDGTRRLGETASGIQLHADAIRRMACMAKVRVAIEREGTLVGLVSASRGVTDQQLEALEFRDRHCTFPGCESTRFLHAHHIRHWADGGQTTLDNLTLLCGRHHRKLHEGGWTIRGRPPDGLEFVDRWGRVRTRAGPVLARAG